MKRLLITIAVCLFSIAGYCQDHMTFKGISMDCTVNEMMSKLSNDGFEKIVVQEGVGIMEGIFSGEKCNIYIYPNSKGKVVRVGVAYDYSDVHWSAIRKRFDTLAANLTKKYGQPTDKEEKFDNLYSEESGRAINGFLFDKNKLLYKWTTVNGWVGMQVLCTYQTGESILLLYEDKINSSVAQEEAYDDL